MSDINLPQPIKRSDMRRVCIRLTDDQYDDLFRLAGRRAEPVQVTAELIIIAFIEKAKWNREI